MKDLLRFFTSRRLSIENFRRNSNLATFAEKSRSSTDRCSLGKKFWTGKTVMIFQVNSAALRPQDGNEIVPEIIGATSPSHHGILPPPRSRSAKAVSRRVARRLRTAMASALGWPMTTTSFLPLVTAV